MDSSSSSLASDWDVVSQTSITKKRSERNENPLISWINAKGSAEDKKCPHMVSGVDDINDTLISNQRDSDIEVIDETLEDLVQLPVPTMKFSINSSISADSPSSSVPPPAAVPVEVKWIVLFQLLRRLLTNSFQRLRENSFQRLRENSQTKIYLVIVFAFVILLFALHFHVNEMNDQVKKLKKQNDQLKSQAISSKKESEKQSLILDEQFTLLNELKDQVEKLKNEKDQLESQAISSKKESEKHFLILDEQLKAIRSDNQMLSESMHSLTKTMEEQSKRPFSNFISTIYRSFSPSFIPKLW